MDKQNLESLQEEAEKKLKKIAKRKRKRMKVSGSGVKKLQRIIIAKQ